MASVRMVHTVLGRSVCETGFKHPVDPRTVSSRISNAAGDLNQLLAENARHCVQFT